MRWTATHAGTGRTLAVSVSSLNPRTLSLSLSLLPLSFSHRHSARAQRHLAAEEGCAARRDLPHDDPLHDPHHELLAALPRLVQQLGLAWPPSAAPLPDPHSAPLLSLLRSRASFRPLAIASAADSLFAAPKIVSHRLASSSLSFCHPLSEHSNDLRCAMHGINVN